MNEADLVQEREASLRRQRAHRLMESWPLLLLRLAPPGATREQLREIAADQWRKLKDGELEAVVDRAVELRQERRGRRIDPAGAGDLTPPKYEPETRVYSRGEFRVPERTEDMERAMPRNKKGGTRQKLSPQQREDLKEWIREQLPAWEGSTADLWRACPFDLPITDKTFFYYVAQIQKEMEAAGEEQDTKRVAAEEEQEKPTAPRDDAAVVAGMPAAPRALNGNGGPPRVHVGQRSDGRYEVYLDTLDAGLAYRVAAAASLLVSDQAA